MVPARGTFDAARRALDVGSTGVVSLSIVMKGAKGMKGERGLRGRPPKYGFASWALNAMTDKRPVQGGVRLGKKAIKCQRSSAFNATFIRLTKQSAAATSHAHVAIASFALELGDRYISIKCTDHEPPEVAQREVVLPRECLLGYSPSIAQDNAQSIPPSRRTKQP